MAEHSTLIIQGNIFQGIRPAFQVALREVRDQFRDWRIIFPILILTLFFPALMNFTANQMVSFVQRYGAPIIAERLIPFLLMIVGFFPISISLVIALESFVGEKERSSIEPLLCTPLSDRQLYLGKLIASTLPPLLAAYLGILVYLVGIYRQVGWQAPPLLLVQIVLLTSIQALVMVSGAVVVSTQTTSVRAANLLASFIIIPMALLIQGEAMVMFWGRYQALWLIIAGLLMIAGLLIRTGLAHFNREELLGRELDTFNLGWMWRIFWSSFLGQARNPLEWYRNELPTSLRKNKTACALVLALLLFAVYIGTTQARVFVLPVQVLNLQELSSGFIQGLETLRLYSAIGVGAVFFQNLRALLIASMIGVFTFGVLGMLIVMLPFILVGYFMTSFAGVGLQPVQFLAAFVLPHGILEIPAIVLAGGAILRLGATLATPAPGSSVGEALLKSLADWARVMLGLVLPLLLAAAALEVLLTPYVAAYVLGG